jgi:iron-sulfur cluster assembly accessory protein
VSTNVQPEITVSVTPVAVTEVMRFMDAEKVPHDVGGLRVSVQPGGCSGFKYGLLIEDAPAEDDYIIQHDGFRMFVDPFSAQSINSVQIDYVIHQFRTDRLRHINAGIGVHVQEPECHRRMRLRQLILCLTIQ